MTPEERQRIIEEALMRSMKAMALRAILRATNPPQHYNCRSSVQMDIDSLNRELDRIEAEAAAGIPTKGRADEAGSWDALEEALGAETVRRMREGG